MADIKWIKITTDIFDDEKILLIENMPDADAIIVIWFKLLCLAGKQNNSGVFMMNDKIAYTDSMLATIFRRKETTVKMALEVFEQFRMIEIVDGVITIPNWGKHQNLDKIEQKTEYMRNYMREYREKQKEIACKTNSKTNVSEADKDKDINIDKEKDIPPLSPKRKDDWQEKMIDERGITGKLKETIMEFLEYKKEKKHSYKPRGFKSFLTEVQGKVSEYGDQAVIDCINHTMSSNYDGVSYWSLNKNQKKNNGNKEDIMEMARKAGLI